jgi:acetyl esterase/lipase
MSYSKLGLLNRLLPHDAEAELRGRDIRYGPALRHRLDIYGPRDGGDRLPVLVFFYGGSWSRGSKEDYSFAGHAFAAQGLVTVIADYRLVPEVEYPEFLHDNAEAVMWAASHIAAYGGNPADIHAGGHSAGAYNAAMIGLDPRFGIAGAGNSTVRSVLGLAGPYDFLPLDTRITRRVFGRAPDLAATQPVRHVSRHAPPMFLASGASDRLVYPRNTRALSRRLREAECAVTERHYRRIGHAGLLLALSQPFRFRAPVLEEAYDFIRQSGLSGHRQKTVKNRHSGGSQAGVQLLHTAHPMTRDGAVR